MASKTTATKTLTSTSSAYLTKETRADLSARLARIEGHVGAVRKMLAENESCDDPRGKIAGHFDPAMSGVCRFACATRLEYDAKDVLAQPGAKAGKLTQCPVSGVVFAVDASRPRVRVGREEYVTCCDKCATK